MKSVITVIGKDAMGITAKISAVCAKCGANIIDISQSVLQDLFVMVMLTENDKLTCSFKDFSECLKKTSDETGLDIRIINEDVFNSMYHV